MMTEQEINFIISNRDMLTGIAEKYLEHYKNIIWKEKDTGKKLENCAVADRLEDLIATIKELKLEKPKKGQKFTGV